MYLAFAVAKPGVVGNAAGSAYMEVGGTKVIAACYGQFTVLTLPLLVSPNQNACFHYDAAFAGMPFFGAGDVQQASTR